MIALKLMVTRRSLNKLERKAHMSLHDTIGLTNEEKNGKSFSWDRFGKKQAAPNNEEKK